MSEHHLEDFLKQIFKDHSFISATISSPQANETSSKITLRPILIKGQRYYQLTEIKANQALHRNLSLADCQLFLKDRLLDFKQAIFYTKENDYHVLIGKKSNIKILKKPPSKSSLPLVHNREKQYLLAEGTPIPFLVELGIMNAEGHIYPKKRDKFRQINRFLEMIDDVLYALPIDRPLHVVDFGCGKAYLTFALYHYLKIVKNYSLQLIGLDLKEEVIKYCQQLAEKLGYEGLSFSVGDINRYQTQKPVQMVVSLHACDTATDAALEKAVRWQADVILSVPCCQHELFNQVSNKSLKPMLKHGILKERFAALATDAARAQLLEVLGYQVQILEFIDLEHTPKNLLIRAIKLKKGQRPLEAWQAYLEFKNALSINPSLEKHFSGEWPLK